MNLIIYLIAFLEGFTTLSVEIVALRQFTPIIGSNSISTSIILGVILLALSAGYYRGGIIADTSKDIKKKLFQNLILSSLYYAFISFIFYGALLEGLLQGTGSYFLSILVSSFILFFIPVFLASQTIPLLSNLLIGSGKAESIGKLLFYSTLGSFLGSVGTSTVLFPLIGADKTALISPLLLIICSLILGIVFLKQKIYMMISIFLFIVYMFIIMNPFAKDSGFLYETSNAYQDIKIVENNSIGERLFLLNSAYSSGINIYTGESSFPYIQEVKRRVELEKPKNILVVGAAGFTFPEEVSAYDFVTNIDVVDIDGNLKDIAEKYFLDKTLSSKINFIAQPSRYFLNTSDAEYDFIFIDVYTGKSLPAQVLTQEFFRHLSEIGKSIYLNFVIDTNLDSNLSKNISTTIRSIFPEIYYKNTSRKPRMFSNFIFTNNQLQDYIELPISDGIIYTDNKHSVEYDTFLLEQSLYKQ